MRIATVAAAAALGIAVSAPGAAIGAPLSKGVPPGGRKPAGKPSVRKPPRPLAAALRQSPEHDSAESGPSAALGSLRMVVERVVQNASLTLDFAPTPPAADAVDGRQTVYVYVAVSGPDRDTVSGIVGFGKETTGVTDTGQQVALRSYAASDGAAPDGRSWRTYMLAHDVEMGARILREVRGELLVYPRSRAARVDFPLHGAGPQSHTVEGLKVTLQEWHWENHTLTATIREEWAADANVARLRPEIPFGVVALAAGGVPAQANEGRSSASERKEGEAAQTFHLVFTDLAEPPERLAVEALVRTGVPTAYPFRLRDIPLPDGDEDPPTSESDTGALLDPALTSANGGDLKASVHIDGRPAGPGTLSLGLRAAKDPAGPWRWLSVPTDAAGCAVVPHLRPGQYRALLRWTPAGDSAPAPDGAGLWIRDTADLVVAPGGTVTLPPLEWRTGP